MHVYRVPTQLNSTQLNSTGQFLDMCWTLVQHMSRKLNSTHLANWPVELRFYICVELKLNSTQLICTLRRKFHRQSWPSWIKCLTTMDNWWRKTEYWRYFSTVDPALQWLILVNFRLILFFVVADVLTKWSNVKVCVCNSPALLLPISESKYIFFYL
jgi:hypothetical protein